MNLCCEELELWQTPTHITYMCMNKVTFDGVVVEDNWQSIRYRYVLWVKSTLTGCHRSEEEIAWYERQNELVKYHIEEVMSEPKLTFYIM